MLSSVKFIYASLFVIILFSISLLLNLEWIPYATLGVLISIVFLLYPKQLFFLLVFAIPFSFEYNFTASLGTDFPDEFLMLSVSAVTVLILLSRFQIQVKQLVLHPIFLLIMLQYAWSLVTAVHSQEPILSWKYALAKLWYFIPFLLAPQLVFANSKSFKTMFYTVVSSILIIAIYVMVRHASWSFSFVTINEAVKPFFRNHVTYALSLSIGFSFLVGLILHIKTLRHHKGMIFSILLLLASIYFSYTRGTWLSIIFSLIILACIHFKTIRLTLTGISLMLVMMVGYLVTDDHYFVLKPDYEKTIIHDNLTEHLDAMYSLKELSASERFYRWIAGVKMSIVHPITGFGPSTFYTQYKPYTDSRFKTYVSDNPEKSTVHNYFLLTLVEQGFVGLFLLIVLLFVFYIRCQNLYHRVNTPRGKAIISILILIMTNIVVVNFFSDMIETDKAGTFYFLCYAMLIFLENNIGYLNEKDTLETEQPILNA